LGKQNKRLAVLWEAAGVLLTTEDPDTMLRGLFEKIRDSLSLDVYFNFMVNESGDALQLVSTTGVDPQIMQSISRLDFGQAVCGNVALRREPIVATFIQQSSEPMVQLVKGLGLRTYACNPLIAGGRLLGTLSFASRQRDSFEREEIAFLETISHYVTLAYERLRLIEQLREQDRRKDEFLATLAHELRNPLAPIRNGLELIRLADNDPAILERATTIMNRQIEQMVRLVDDLLDVARISRNKLDLRKERVSLDAIVRNAVETSRPVLAAAEHDLQVNLPSEPILLDADPVRLAQVFSNLLNNAAKYSKRGGHISLAATQTGDELTIRVSDTGIGIEPGKLSQIFGMFVQLDTSEQQVQSGLGVGLTLVQRLIEMHGGSIEARSEGQGKGSEFIVRLPALKPSHEIVSASKPVADDVPTPRRRILVVDDNVDSAESMAMMLELSGHDVATAHDGLEAVEVAREFQPHVALLDLGMPKLDGYEAARSIRRQSWGQKMMLVALTGWGQSEDKRRSREAGFDAHLVKPIDFGVLEELIDKENGSQI
jgi:signal transduction histidine kinase/ActR/RegA family two-component response regulator